CSFGEGGTGSRLERGHTLRVARGKDVVRVVDRLQNFAFFRIEAFHHSRLLLCLGMPWVTHGYSFIVRYEDIHCHSIMVVWNAYFKGSCPMPELLRRGFSGVTGIAMMRLCKVSTHWNYCPSPCAVLSSLAQAASAADRGGTGGW